VSELIDYRLAFILSESRQLLATRDHTGHTLPTLAVSPLQRPAAQLTMLIESQWKIKTIVLDIITDEALGTPCAVIEIRSSSWNFAQDGLFAVHPDQVSESWLGASERLLIISILEDRGRSPFCRIGWIEEAQCWIRSAVADREVRFTENMAQFNAGGPFCLVRFGTVSGPAYWLKAVGQPNEHEFAITSYLAKTTPDFLPRVVAMREDWNAWVMEDGGESLHGSTDRVDFERATKNLAALQIRLTGKPEELIASNCSDHRLKILDAHTDEFVDYLDEAMQLQRSNAVPRLASSRLKYLGSLLHQHCSLMDELQLPETLLHGDMSPGSILSNGVSLVFTDWCEAYVGNPFITLAQFCAHVARRGSESLTWVPVLKNVYASCWSDILSEKQIEGALRLTPLVSVLSYLVGRNHWLHTSRRRDEAVRSYARSLARHLDRIASQITIEDHVCQ